jgi:hypothetical protein
MPTFRTAEDLEKRYAVVASCLLAFAERGNLAMRRVGSQLQFDERAVARLFPRRAAIGGNGTVIGQVTLGACRLGTR